MGLHPLNIFDPETYPTKRDEDWKWSDLTAHWRGQAAPILDDTVLPNVPHSVNIKDSCVIFEWGYSRSTPFHERLEYVLSEGVSMLRVMVLDEDPTTTSIRQSTIKLAAGATFKQFVFSTGAGFQRVETHVEHGGHGAHVDLNGAYRLKDTAHFDYTTRITHTAPGGTTRQVVKGLVKDKATGIFQGRITVARGADDTNAEMEHHALILNDGARVRAKPELEIYADDVACSHGNTIGALDEAALFFCQSRGMDVSTARAMLTQAFIAPVIDEVPDEDIRTKVMAFLEKHAEGFHAL